MSNLTDLTAKVSEHEVPEIFNKGTFCPMDQIIGKECKLLDYMVYESNKDIYKDDNKRGVAMLVSVDGAELRVSTHAKAIVRDLAALKDAGIDPRGTDFKIIYKDYKGKKILVFA